ncbi:MAG TPA: sodium-independent anion transporter, partial [Candidatus Tenderia electrophaga]|nr:sodium-independent anion transporter [Candidatus Tenderia electrophaga]
MNKSKSLLPIMDWLPKYRREQLGGDINAGIIVTIVLIPQAMAYAMLAGLPPEIGLYSCLLPIILYALFGSSRTLAIGPVGLVSLIVGSTIMEMNLQGQAQALTVAITLACMSGILLLLMRILTLGSVINFISHPVLSGFTSAAAVLIILSQLKHLLGLETPRAVHLPEALTTIISHLNETNPVTALLGLGSIAIMLLLRSGWLRQFAELKQSAKVIDIIARAGPLIVVSGTIIIVWRFALDSNANVNIVGTIPAGLPALSIPSVDIAMV